MRLFADQLQNVLPLCEDEKWKGADEHSENAEPELPNDVSSRAAEKHYYEAKSEAS